MTVATFLSNTFVLGLLEAAPLVLAAVGFTIIFKLNGFVNVAFAENLTIGAYFGALFNTILGMNYYIAIIPAVILTGVLSALTYIIIFRPAIRRGVGKTEMIILSVGVSFLLRYGIKLIFGNDLYNFSHSSISFLRVLGVGVTDTQLVCIGLAALISVAIVLFMFKTNYGEKMRALADNEQLAKTSGINPFAVSVLIWFIAGVAGGLSGVFYGTFAFVSSALGWNQILLIMMVAIVGGIGNIKGAIIAGIIASMASTAVTLFSNSSYGLIVLLLVFIVVLKLKKVRI